MLRSTCTVVLGTGMLLAPIAAGCTQRGDAPTTSAVTERDAASDETHRWTRPTEEECRTYAGELEQAVAAKDMAAFNAKIDWDALFDRVTHEVDAPAEFEQGFRQGALESIETNGGFVGQIMQTVKAEGGYKLLRVYEKQGEWRALFRLLNNDGALNYHDFSLAKSTADGAVRAIDVLIFASGEPFSQTLRRFYIMGAAAENKTHWEKLLGANKATQADFTRLGRITSLHQSGRSVEALPIFAELSPEFRNEKAILLMRIQLADLVEDGGATYEAALEDYRRIHPIDAAADFHSIDYFFLKGDYDEALAAIDRIDQAVQGDPYLHVLRANLYLESGDADAASQAVEQAISEDSALIEAYLAWINITLQQRDFDGTLQALRTMRDRLQWELTDLSQQLEFAEFVRSPQYQQWLKSKASGYAPAANVSPRS